MVLFNFFYYLKNDILQAQDNHQACHAGPESLKLVGKSRSRSDLYNRSRITTGSDVGVVREAALEQVEYNAGTKRYNIFNQRVTHYLVTKLNDGRNE